MADLKHIARRIFHETLAAINIPEVMRRKLQLEGSFLHCDEAAVDLRAFTKIRVVALGKASHAMVEGLAWLLPANVAFQGIVSAPTPPRRPVRGMDYFLGGHPLPNAGSWQAAEAIIELLKGSDERTLVFFLLSGGGSALVERPLDPQATLEDIQQLYQALVTCGAPIYAINAVRKHFSAIKGGRLAAAAAPAMKITLAATDVPAGQESALGSGPTLPDPTTVEYVNRVVEDYSLREKLPPTLRRWIAQGTMPETPKEGDPAFANSHFLLLLGMDDLFHPAHCAAEAKGFMACCDNSTDDWAVERAAGFLLEQLEKMQREYPGHRVALIADGELSSTVMGNGVGGRNSAFVLACVERIAGRHVAVLSAGTDGIDGNSPAAGAVADGETLAHARAIGLEPSDFLDRSDAFTFFFSVDDAIVTGPTGNNLRDLRILLAEP
jgi:glycerate 2-kinase